jgi:hypothetical protein
VIIETSHLQTTYLSNLKNEHNYSETNDYAPIISANGTGRYNKRLRVSYHQENTEK